MADDVAERALGDRLDAVDGLEVDDVLLDVGREQQEVEDLGDRRAREAELVGELGPVAVLAAIDGLSRPGFLRDSAVPLKFSGVAPAGFMLRPGFMPSRVPALARSAPGSVDG